MRTSFLTLLSMFSLVSCSSTKKNSDAYAKLSDSLHQPEITEKAVKEHMRDWPEASQKAAHQMLSKYGAPQEVTGNSMTWYKSGPFKRSVVYREEFTHHFPMKHTDVLEQVVDYRVPFTKVDDLWHYDGSVTLAKTRGELASRGESEEMNILALNLAYEIVTDKKSSHEARKEYTKAVSEYLKGEVSTRMQTLNFTSSEKSEDPDLSTIKEDLPKSAKN